jgi:hypothetical protein
MTPRKHPSNNLVVRKPMGWDDRGGVLELPAIDVTQGTLHGVKVFMSRWKPSPDELICLMRGGEVQLTCIGGQPAVNVSAVDETGVVTQMMLPQ